MTATTTSKCLTATTIALAVALPGCGATATERIHHAPAAHVVTATSQATRLREFRQMIIGLYRVPERPAAGGEPLDALWRSLATQYGVVQGIST